MVEKMPSIDELALWSKAGKDKDGRSILYKKCRERYDKNGLMLPLLRWIYTSNKAHIRRLRPSEKIKEVDSNFQFILMTGSAEKEAKFQELKRETHFARELMTKWNRSAVLSELNAVLKKRHKEVQTLLSNGTTLYTARALLQCAVKAVNIATSILDEKLSDHDIDSYVVKEATKLMSTKKGRSDVVKKLFDEFSAQKKELDKANVQLPPSANASNATPVSKTGSFWAWHGSAIESWHLILRTGLRNLSGTTLQAFGTAYGSGVYFGKDLSVSTGYAANSGNNWKCLQFDKTDLSSQNTMCLALCEVINRPEDFTSTNPYFVVPNEDFITTRFIFLLPKGRSTQSCAARSVTIPPGLIERAPKY